MADAAFEDALQAWVKETTGLEAVWIRQKLHQAVPFVSLQITGPATLTPQPDRSQRYDGAAPAGQEIALDARGVDEWVLHVQAYTVATSGAGDAKAVLKRLKDSLRLMGTVSRLRAAGITVADVGSILDLSAVIETDWQGRAALDLRLWTADVSTERTTYIEEVVGQGQDDLAVVNLDAKLP